MAGAISPMSISPTMLKPTAQTLATDLAKPKLKDASATATTGLPDERTLAAAHAKAKETGEKFEAQFLSSMFQNMFEGLQTDGPFGGGQGESMFRSLMTEAMGKQVAKTGGIGLSTAVQHEILKMQGLQ